MIDSWKPWAEKPGDPHLHRCGCGHSYAAPLQSGKSPCPSCTDANGHNWLDRQAIHLARSVIGRHGSEFVLGKK